MVSCFVDKMCAEIAHSVLKWCFITLMCDEDKVAYERNIKLLMVEFKKAHSRREMIRELVALTFKVRRQIIETSQSYITEFISDFLFFGDVEWVSLDQGYIL